jgi:chromosome segregation ATPase
MDILQLVGIVIGSNSVVGFIVALITIKYQKSKVQGEAHSAQYEGMKVEQDTYQELILDLKSAWKEQKDYIAELHEDRRNLRVERDDLKKQIDTSTKKIANLESQLLDLEVRNNKLSKSTREAEQTATAHRKRCRMLFRR